MSNLRQAAQQALRALERIDHPGSVFEFVFDEEIAALRAALAEPEQEPVAWMDIDDNGQRLAVRQWSDGNSDEVPLYTAPPPRKPLTVEQLKQIELRLRVYADNDRYDLSLHGFARAIERAHGIGGEA